MSSYEEKEVHLSAKLSPSKIEAASDMEENSAKDELSTTSPAIANTKIEEKDDERLAKINFICTACQMNEMVHYFGEAPSFVFDVQFQEPTYVLRDPFQPPPPRWKAKAEYFIPIGANCNICNKMICKDSECSFFYIKTYCLTCAYENLSQFPLEIQQKLHKL